MKILSFWWGAGLAGVSFAAVGWERKPRSPLPLAAWLPGLVERHGQPEALRLAALAEDRCRNLLANISPQASPALRAQLVNHILPGLAMYQTLLDAQGGDRQTALGEIEPLFQAWTQRLYGSLMRTFRLLPFPFFFFRLGFAIQKKQMAGNIFKTCWIEDSPRRIALDQFGCPYLDTLAAQGAPELTPYFCQIDDWMAELLPAQIAFRRTQTLARGGDRCDFRYERI